MSSLAIWEHEHLCIAVDVRPIPFCDEIVPNRNGVMQVVWIYVKICLVLSEYKWSNRGVKLWYISVGVFLCIHAHAGVILIGDAIQTNQCLVWGEIKGCQIRYWIVGKWSIRISRFFTAYVLINVRKCVYHSLCRKPRQATKETLYWRLWGT